MGANAAQGELELQPPGVALAAEAEPVVVGADHAWRLDRSSNPAVGQQATATPDELAR
jgi:hypothetical protein